MGFPVYDFRNPDHITNMLVTPQIRSRFLRMEPGLTAKGHTHDLGQEIFLILSGRCEFTIDGETEELGPGQMCIALIDQMHQVRVIGDEPMIMYLSVTPHVQPTHTYWDEQGNKLPPHFNPNSNYDLEVNDSLSVEDLLEQQALKSVRMAQAAAKVAEVNMAVNVDGNFGVDSRERMWEALRELHLSLADMDDNWNELAPRANPTD